MPCKRTGDIVSDESAALNLGSCPHSELQDVLELLGEIIPPVVITGPVRGKIIIDIVSAAGAVCDDVIGLPLLVFDFAAAYVAATCGLSEDLSSFCGGQCSPGLSDAVAFTETALAAEGGEVCAKVGGRVHFEFLRREEPPVGGSVYKRASGAFVIKTDDIAKAWPAHSGSWRSGLNRAKSRCPTAGELRNSGHGSGKTLEHGHLLYCVGCA